MKAIILAAGLGTRLRPLTENFAKPALPVLGVPGLWFAAWHLRRKLNALKPGAFAINISHAPETVRIAAQEKEIKKKLNIDFYFSDETKALLGSSGALWKLKSWIGKEEFLVTNADSISFHDWEKLIDAHSRNKAKLTLHLREFESRHETYTCFKTDSKGKVLKMTGKGNRGVMFTGNYIAHPDVIAELPDGYSDLKPSLLDLLVKRGELYAYEENVPWLDLGNIPSFVEAQKKLLVDFPEARELIEMKMKECGKNVWVPRDWTTQKAKSSSFTVLLGNQQKWENLSATYGPDFFGLAAPTAEKLVQTKKMICLGEVQQTI